MFYLLAACEISLSNQLMLLFYTMKLCAQLVLIQLYYEKDET